MGAAILLPARFIVLGAEGTLLAPAYGFDPVAGDAERDQVVFRGIRTALAETQVVFG